MATADVCRRHGISSATFYTWKSKYGGLKVSEVRRLRTFEEENAWLKASGWGDARQVVPTDLAQKMERPALIGCRRPCS